MPAAQRVLELHGDKHVFSIAARDFMNALARSQGRHVEALASTQLLMTDLEALFGEGNPVTGILCLSAAESAVRLERGDLGLELLRQAEPLSAGLSPDHPFLVLLYRLRAELQLQSLDTKASMTTATEAVRRASDPSVHPVERGRAYLALAKAKMALGDRNAQARANLDRAGRAFANHPQHQRARVEEVATLLGP